MPGLGEIELREIARRQRHLLSAILAFLVLQILPLYLGRIVGMVPMTVGKIVPMLCGLIWLSAYVLVAVCVVRLQLVERESIAVRLFTVMMLLAPCINLLILCLVNLDAMRTLRDGGLRLGFMGISDEDVRRQLNSDECRECGYLLIGNTSGICPECGTRIELAAGRLQ